MAEIADEELAVLKRSHEVLLKLNQPTTRPMLEKALKTHYPDIQTEEDQATRLLEPQLKKLQDEVIAPLAETVNAFKTEREQAQERATAERLENAFGRLKADEGFTDEGLEQIKKLMVDRSIADPDAAAALFNKLNPPPPQEAASYQPQQWTLESATGPGVDVAMLFQDEDRFEQQMIASTLNEIRVGRQA